MPTRLLALLLALLAPVALGASSTSEKRLSRRMETDTALQAFMGGASVPSTLSKLTFLGEEAYAADQLTLLLRKAVDERLRRNLAAVLAGLSVRGAEPTLAQLTQDRDGAVRMYAAQGLGRLRSRRVNVLIPLLEDKSSGVRKEAARALGASRTAKVGKLLVGLAKTEQDLEVRTAMLVATGETGDAKQAPALKGFLTSDSEATRFGAARALCLLGHKDGFAFADKLLTSQDRFVRRQGLALFEGVAAKKGDAALRPLLEDKDRGSPPAPRASSTRAATRRCWSGWWCPPGRRRPPTRS